MMWLWDQTVNRIYDVTTAIEAGQSSGCQLAVTIVSFAGTSFGAMA